MTHIGILQCGALPEEAQEPYGDIPELLIHAFNQVDPSLEFTIFDAINDDLPNMDLCDAFLCSGSTSSTYERTPWILSLEDFIRECARVGKKLLGVCFGHQLINQALGGTVLPCERGWALGTGFYELTTQKSWMKPSTGKVDVLVMHRDQITTLPEKSQIIAHSQFCPYFMVQHGPNILTIQGHPEFTSEVLQHLTDVNIDNFTANKIREAQATLSAPLDSANILQWMVNFIKMDIPKRKQQYLNVPQKPL